MFRDFFSDTGSETFSGTNFFRYYQKSEKFPVQSYKISYNHHLIIMTLPVKEVLIEDGVVVGKSLSQPRQPGCRDLFQGRLCQNHIKIQDLYFNIKQRNFMRKHSMKFIMAHLRAVFVIFYELIVATLSNFFTIYFCKTSLMFIQDQVDFIYCQILMM